jgi:hypothetical protein
MECVEAEGENAIKTPTAARSRIMMKCIVLPPMFKNTREVVLVVAALRSPEH